MWILWILLFCNLSLADEAVYVTTHQGKTIFSDIKPRYTDNDEQTTEKKTIKKPQAFHAPLPQTRARTHSQLKSEVKLPSYSVTFISPLDKSTFQRKPVDVVIQVSPRLKSGVKLRLLLDKKSVPIGSGQKNLFRARLEGVPRGAHSLKAQIVYGDDILAESEMTIYMHRPRVKKSS